ncbi:hypothetical protein AB4P17_09865 [Escherichia coli]|uniref:hypothetical protein n=1 Tax=Escherichia coli TaxID=562 RepID=UPI0034C6740B
MTTPITKEQLTRIIESADEVISALAGLDDGIHPGDSERICGLWDDLNYVYVRP